jgi:hypothetical protein
MQKLFLLKQDEFIGFWKISGKVESERDSKILVVSTESSKTIHSFYPNSAMDEISIETKFETSSAGPLVVAISPFFVSLDDTNHHSSISRTRPDNYLTYSDELIIRHDKSNYLKVHYSAGCVHVEFNGISLNFESSYNPSIDSICITWPPHTKIVEIDIFGTESANFLPLLKSKKNVFHMTVDFPDDVISAPYTRQMFVDMMKNNMDMGVNRIYWNYYPYGDNGCGTWDPTGCCQTDENVRRTFEDIGGDDLKLAVETAHNTGLEIYAVFKPFDLQYGKTFPFSSELAKKYGKGDILGGKGYPIHNFVAEHPELCMKRRNIPESPKDPISKIVVASHDKSAILPKNIEIWVSDDNWKYRLYDKPYKTTMACGVISIDHLNINNKYMAIGVPGWENNNKFANTLSELIHLYDSQGSEVGFTYGLYPRRYSKYSPGDIHLVHKFGNRGGFKENGFFFDYQEGIPTAVFNSDQPLNRYFTLDNEDGVLGIALDHSKFVPGCMCPSELEARQFWFDNVKSALEKGVDGIDIRVSNHCTVFDWKQYGFNQPVVEEFRKRYGVDVLHEDFDEEAWRRLRGEYYTEFLKKVKSEIKGRNKKLQLHISDMMEGTPDKPTMMNIYWDWHNWLEQDICDEVTFKALNPNSFRSTFGRELIFACREKNIPVYFSPFVHRISPGNMCQVDWKDYISKQVPDSGVSGLILYEHATLFASRPDGKIENLKKEFTDFVRRKAEH